MNPDQRVYLQSRRTGILGGCSMRCGQTAGQSLQDSVVWTQDADFEDLEDVRYFQAGRG